MKSIALFGVSGKTGLHFLSQSLDKGYKVKALTRKPSSIHNIHHRLTVIEGNVLSAADVDRTIEDCNIAVSLFTHVRNSPPWLQTNGIRNIVSSMKKYGTERLISLSPSIIPYPEKDRPGIRDKLTMSFWRLRFPSMWNDSVNHYEFLQERDIKWVIVRAPGITDERKRERYRIGWMGVNAGTRIGKEDLAHFILRLIEDESFDFQLPYVSY